MDSRLIEELTLNAWPPLETLLFDGWILSFSDGYTRRANSVPPLYPSSLPLDGKIGECEAAYARRGREVTFKITSSPDDAELDRALEQRGYVMAAPTSVQSAELRSTAFVVDPSVALSTTLEDGWFADFNRLTLTPEVLQASERRLLEKIVPPHCFASIAIDGSTVVVGLGVAERGQAVLVAIAGDVRV